VFFPRRESVSGWAMEAGWSAKPEVGVVSQLGDALEGPLAERSLRAEQARLSSFPESL
jgi:hypothetical protein